MARVVLQVDDSAFHRDLRRDQQVFHRTTNDMSRDASRAGRGALAGSGAFRSLGRSVAFASASFLGAAGFTAVIRQSISAASNLHEQINKTDVVFRSSGQEVKRWSKDTATSLGIARGEALAFASTFGNLLVPMGFARKEAAGVSVSLVKLAADLASFNNASPEDTLQALQSGLAGQARPLRQFGIFLSEDRVKAEALATGIAKTTKSTDEITHANTRLAIAEARLVAVRKEGYGPGTTQYAAALDAQRQAQVAVSKALQGHTVNLDLHQKAQARLAIIMRDSADAQGDFARTSGGLANQQRILAAQVKEVEERIGTALMPTVLRITKAITSWLGNTKNMDSLQRNLNRTLTVSGTVLGGLWRAIDRVQSALGGWKNVLVAVTGAFVGMKVAGVASAIAIRSAQLVAAGVVSTAWKAALISTGFGALAVAAGIAAVYIITHWEKVKKWFEEFVIRLQVVGVKLGLALAEPMSHLPGIFGKNARKAKEQMLGELRDLGNRAAALEMTDGQRAAAAFLDSYNKEIKDQGGIPLIQDGKLVPQTPGGGTPGTTKGGNRGIVSTAQTASRAPGASGAGFRLPGEAGPPDCSAFTQAVYRQNGISIGRNTTSQWGGAKKKSRRAAGIAPGDLIFFFYGNGTSPPPDHVGIYIGGGQLIEDHGSSRGVTTGGVNWSKFYGWARYTKAGDTAATSPVGTGTDPVDTSPALTVGPPKTKKQRREDAYKKRLEDARTDTITPHKFAPTRIFGAISAAFGAYQSGTHLVTRGSPFGRIKYQVPNEKPQDEPGWRKVQRDIVAAAKKIRARLIKAQRRLKKLRKALRHANKARRPNPTIIHRLRQHIADALTEIAELKDELKVLREDYIVAEEAIAALKGEEGIAAGELPPELELKGIEAEGTEDTADDLSVLQEEKAYFEGELAKATTPQARAAIQSRLNQINQQIKDLLSTATDAREAELLNLPATIRLAIAQSALTPDTADDLQALKAAEAFYAHSLANPNLNIETRIQLTDLLASIRAQIADLTGAKADAYAGTIESYLSAVRDLRQYRGNIFDFPSPTAGAAVNVTNNYLTQPEDPHLWSNAVLFDLRAGVS
jgi:hypothetical protein